MAKCDMHLHSCFSKELLFGYVQGKKLKWFEKLIIFIHNFSKKTAFSKTKPKKWSIYFTPGFNPKQLYDIAMKRGMDFFTLTDHDTIEGWKWLVKNYPELRSRVVPGVELTSNIPGKNFGLHINIFGLNEKQFNELKKIAEDVNKVVRYCNKNGLICSINHISNSFVQKMATEQRDEEGDRHIRGLLKLFKFLEGRNRLVYEKINNEAEDLAKKYRKIMIAGTDSHIGEAGRTWTEVNARTKEEFIEGIKKGKTKVGGEHGSAGCLKDELIKQSKLYEGLYYNDGIRNFDKKLDIWGHGFFKGIIFQLVSYIVQVFIFVSAGRVVKWTEENEKV